MPRISAEQAGGLNRLAFLDMIAHSEIGPALLAATDDGYNVLVGATPAHPLTFPSYATHPNILNRMLNSTAAGRYQALNRYARAYMASLKLSDFAPVAQDQIALQQIRECRALPFVDLGHFATAVGLVNHIWASLPGAGYQQHENALADLQSAYVEAGGTLSGSKA